ncbi:MAG: guanylate kinase [Lentisphaeria bacterium]|nr:guanylate kinase [Lentisphaeria bacterium]
MDSLKRRLGLVIVLSGPSGAGKTTVYRQLLEQRADVEFSVSCTTRPPRTGETDGRDYHFISREDFLLRRDQAAFLEHAEVHANYYGTLREEVERRIAAGVSVLLDVDVQGARAIRKAVADTPLAAHTIFIFTAPPSVDLLEFRLRKRDTDSEAVIQTRLSNAREELTAWREYDYFLVNDGVKEAVRDFSAIIDGALQKTSQWLSTPWEK